MKYISNLRSRLLNEDIDISDGNIEDFSKFIDIIKNFATSKTELCLLKKNIKGRNSHTYLYCPAVNSRFNNANISINTFYIDDNKRNISVDLGIDIYARYFKYFYVTNNNSLSYNIKIDSSEYGAELTPIHILDMVEYKEIEIDYDKMDELIEPEKIKGTNLKYFLTNLDKNYKYLIFENANSRTLDLKECLGDTKLIAFYDELPYESFNTILNKDINGINMVYINNGTYKFHIIKYQELNIRDFI
jgi:hypothetical protein